MSRAKRWTVEILIHEDDGTTHAVARLDTSEDAHLHGHGTCRGADDPDDRAVVVAGHETAVAEALREVADKLTARASAVPGARAGGRSA